jgi:hypothetical protein
LKGFLHFGGLVIGLCLGVLSTAAFAQDSLVDLAYPSRAYTKDAQSILAENDEPQGKSAKKNSPPATNSDFKERWLTGPKVHEYLGLATIVAAGATALSAPEGGCEHNSCNSATYVRDTNGIHAHLAKATGALAVATVLSGLLVHWDDFNLDDGWADPDNLHVLLGVSGAATMLYAINKSANSATPVSHSLIAEIGAIAMAIGIRLTW